MFIQDSKFSISKAPSWINSRSP